MPCSRVADAAPSGTACRRIINSDLHLPSSWILCVGAGHFSAAHPTCRACHRAADNISRGALTVGQVPALRISRLSNLFLQTACVWLVNRGPILAACFRIQWWGCTTTVTSQLTSSQPISLPLEPVDSLRNELITFWSLVLWQSAGVRHLQGIIRRVETGAVGASP